MIKTATLLTLSLSLATGALALGYLLEKLWLWTFIVVLLGISWWFETHQHRDWTAALFLIGFIGLIAGSVQMQVKPGLLLVSLIAALSVWDLHHFLYQSKDAPEHELTKKPEPHHLRRLLIVDALGGGFAGVALTARLHLGLGMLLFLSAVAIVCLSQFIRSLRQASD